MNGRVALVTGGGRGIGREAALLLSAAGARVMVVSRSATELSAVGLEYVAADLGTTSVDANRHMVIPGFFETLGMHILDGRDIQESDSKTKPHGSAASCGMVNGVISISPIENWVPE